MVVKVLGIAGSVLALLVALLREVPFAILAGGVPPPGTSNPYSLAMFATAELEVFSWGTIAGSQVTLLAGFSLAGAFSLLLWGLLVLAVGLGISGSTPHARPKAGQTQRGIAAFFLLACAGVFLSCAIAFSPAGIAGLRLGWYCIVASGVFLGISARNAGPLSPSPV